MQAPAPHPREAERLRALQALRILDTGPDPRFDALTRTACRLFNVPTALVSLVDEQRQWFKSRQGLDATETPREISFCGHAILGAEPFVVQDALRDPRFLDNPLVAGDLGLRFYAGIPLHGPEGLPYGTLCLLDYAPRSLTPDQIAALKDLALLAEAELQAQPAGAAEAKAELEGRFNAVIAAMGEGVVFQDAHATILGANAAAQSILGGATNGPHWQAIHEDGSPWPWEDQPPSQALRTGQPQVGQVMGVPQPDGRLLWIQVTSEPIRDRAGELSGVVSTFLDITERKGAIDRLRSSEARFRMAFEHSGIGIALLDLDGHWQSANRALCAMLGYSEAELRAFTFQELTHPEDQYVGDTLLPKLLDGEIPVIQAEKRYRRKDGSYLRARLTTTLLLDAQGDPYQIISQVEDITAQKEAESTLRKADERYRAMTENVPGVMYQFQVWPDGRVAFPFISQRIQELYGISPEQWRTDPAWALNMILPEDRPSYEEAYTRAAASLQTFLWEGRTRTARPGEVLWIRCQSRPSAQEDGSILWDGLVTDTTALRREAEKQARQAAFHLSLLTSAEVAIISTDLNGVVTSFNAHAEALLGWTETELIEGHQTPALWHDPGEVLQRAKELSRIYGREIPPSFDVFVHLARRGGIEQREWTFLTRDGHQVPVLLTVSSIRDATDTVVGFLAVGADLRALKAREAAHLASEQKFRDLVASVPGVVFQSRPLPGNKREFTFISDYCRVILGLEPEEVKAHPGWLEELVLPEDQASLMQSIFDAREKQGTLEWVGRMRRRSDGQVRWMRMQATPWKEPDGSLRWNGLLLDLTERIDSELALRQSEERLALILKGSNDAPWDWDLEHGSLYYSPRWWQMLGYADQELPVTADLLSELTHPDDREPVAHALEAVLNGGGESYEVEFRLRHKAGHFVPVLSRGFIQRNEAGVPIRISGTNMDLSERRATEEALRQLEERWSLALQANNDGIWDWNVLTDEIWFSPRYASMLGFDPPELPNVMSSWSERCHPEDLPGAQAQVEAYIRGHSPAYQLVFRMRHKDGSWRWILSRGVGTRGPDGRMTRIVGSHQDITQQREAERALVASQARSQALLEAMPDLIFLVDREGNHLEVHAHSESSLRRPKGEILGKNMRDVMPPELLEDRMARIRRVLDSGVSETYETRVETLGGLQDHETRVVPCGRETVLVIARDISERKALERLKSDFISTVSHELRTPLTSIKGALGLMTGGVAGSLSPKALELSRMALENANRLARLIDDLLDLAKTESAELSLDLKVHDLGQLLTQALEGIAGFAHAHQVALAPTWDVAVAMARVDGGRLIQVVLNLLSNAVKYSAAGGAVQVRLLRQGPHWRVEVENHGPEIPEAFRARIFQKFAMADGSDTRTRGGTGLGLAISKALVERMGGAIDYHSAGDRTVFSIELPLAEEVL